MSNVPLNKVNDYLYEIPQVGAMRVPGRIYASDELIEPGKRDEAIGQVMNVATLPGIVKHSLAMPDFHWGYGFPIGGVAAFDPLEGGIVSPGGIGYDINCLAGDARVLFPDGYTRTIRDIVDARRRDRVSLVARRARIDARVVAGFAQKPRRPVFELLTASGRTIVATEDHPLLTPAGMREMRRLQARDRVALLPFDGVPYEEPPDAEIVPGLSYRDPLVPSLLRLAGLVLGDGSIHFDRGTGKGHVSITGKRDDLRKLARDVRPWVRMTRVYSRRRRHAIRTTYGKRTFESVEHFVHVNSTRVARLLVSLGVPAGPKASQDWGVPAWLHRAPLWQKRLFLAAFFGAEMSTPRAVGVCFQCPTLTVVKRDGFVPSGERFLRDVARLLEEFGVRTLTVSRRAEQENLDGTRSHRLRLLVAGEERNLIAFWSKVGFECNAARAQLAARAVAYLRRKHAELAVRSRLRERILEIRAISGWGANKILAAVGATNLRFVERTIYGCPERVVRTPEGFPTFAAWQRRWATGDIVWDEVVARAPRRDVKRVYDITVDHRDHNFVADGFVVSNCGVRLMSTRLAAAEVKPRIREVVRELFRAVPAGVGSDGAIRTPSKSEAHDVVTKGAAWAIEKGYGRAEDVRFIEEGGCLKGADPDAVSERAYSRGLPQIGTLGSGNHFLEVQVVEEVYRPDIAAKLGLEKDGIAIAIHSGSRGFGYQVCDDFIALMMKAARKYGITLADRQLCCAPLHSQEAARYIGAMYAAANFAWVNRQVMMALSARALAKVLGRDVGMRLIYDVCHNIGKYEEHGGRRVFVHRKGATRALPPGHPLVPEAYREIGQPVFVPGDMGRASFLLIGNARASGDTFASTCHGAGRQHSRSAMKKMMAGQDLYEVMEKQYGVVVMGHSRDGVAEEMPQAYKDATKVVDVMERAGISDKVVRLKPIGCVKG
jgi:tRNA-splicing ligase RtcB